MHSIIELRTRVCAQACSCVCTRVCVCVCVCVPLCVSFQRTHLTKIELGYDLGEYISKRLPLESLSVLWEGG